MSWTSTRRHTVLNRGRAAAPSALLIAAFALVWIGAVAEAVSGSGRALSLSETAPAGALIEGRYAGEPILALTPAGPF